MYVRWVRMSLFWAHWLNCGQWDAGMKAIMCRSKEQCGECVWRRPSDPYNSRVCKGCDQGHVKCICGGGAQNAQQFEAILCDRYVRYVIWTEPCQMHRQQAHCRKEFQICTQLQCHVRDPDLWVCYPNHNERITPSPDHWPPKDMLGATPG